MKRRDFLRWSVCSMLGALLGQGEILPAEAAYYEPMIYKRFCNSRSMRCGRRRKCW